MRDETARAMFERGWNNGDFTGLEHALAGELDFHYRRGTRRMRLADLRDAVARWRAAFPDHRFDVDDLVEAGDVIAMRLTHTGTHWGRWQDLEPTGRRFEVDTMFFLRFDKDRIAEVWEVDDEIGIRQQLLASPG